MSQPERMGRIVRSVTIQPDGSLAVEYITPLRDLKSNGVELNHVVFVPIDSDYTTEIDAVIDAVLALLNDVLEDVEHLGMPVIPDVSGLDEDGEEEQDETQECAQDRCVECAGCTHFCHRPSAIPAERVFS